MSQALGEMLLLSGDELALEQESGLVRPLMLAVDARAEFVAIDGLLPLAARVAPRVWPEANLELAAVLESEGITDAVAQKYGASDVFELAERLLVESTPAPRRVGSSEPEQTVQSWYQRLRSSLRSPAMLLIMALMLIQLRVYDSALQIAGAPHWTTIVGLICGTLIAGGAMQSLGWRVSMALSQGTRRAVLSILMLGMVFGLGLALAVAIILVGVGVWLKVSVAGLVGLGVSCVALTLLLLLSGSLTLIRRTPLAVGALVVAFGATSIVDYVWPMAGDHLLAVVLGYTLAVLLLGGVLVREFRKLISRTKQSAVAHLPPPGQLLYGAIPYLCYGILSVLYIVVGQVGGWSGSLGDGWTRQQALASLNNVHLFGLATLVLSQGLSRYAMRSFWDVMRSAQGQITAGDQETIGALIRQFLLRHQRRLLLVQLSIAIILAIAALWCWQFFSLEVSFGPLMPSMLWISLVGYSLLAWGLFSCSFLVMLSQPWLAVRALAIAVAIQFVGGMVLQMIWGLEASVAGMIIGGCCLVGVTQWTLSRMLRRSDYALYQAF
jgi:hypothetical protein